MHVAIEKNVVIKSFSCANIKVLHFIYQAYIALSASVEKCTLHKQVFPSRPELKNSISHFTVLGTQGMQSQWNNALT
jgi:hypothetical protein